MENNDQNNTDAPTQTAPVMDVQPPKQTVAPEAPAAEEAVAETPVATPPAETENSEEAMPVNEADSEAESVPEVPAPSAENPMAITPQNAGPAKHRAPVGAIIAAIVLALLLAGATVYAYAKTKHESNAGTSKSSQTAAKTTPAEAQTKVDAGDVQQTSQDIDDNLKSIDNNTDFSSTDLSDSSLGL